MNKARRALLAERRARVARLATDAVCGETIDHLKGISTEIADLDEMIARTTPRAPPWSLALGIAAVCLLALGITRAVGFSQAEIQIDAVVRELSFKNRERLSLIGPPVDLAGGTLRVTGWTRDGRLEQRFVLPAVEGNVAKTLPVGSALHELTLTAGARLTVVSDQGGCYRLVVSGGKLLGTLAVQPSLSPGKPDSGLVPPETSRFEASDATTFSFCAPKGLRFTVDRINDLLIEAAYLQGPPPVSLPSILSGNVGVPAIDRQINLKDTDRVRLHEVVDGHLLLALDRQIRVAFAGTVKRPTLAGTFGTEDLRPNVLEYLRSSPMLALLSGAFLAFWGFAWNVKQRLFG